MVSRLVLKTSNPQTLLESMHQLGQVFLCETGQEIYKVIYFAQHRQIFFEGHLSPSQLDRVKHECVTAKSIEIDDFNNEIVIEE